MLRLRFLRWPTYLLAAMLITVPFLDLLVTVLPLQGSNVRWRVGTTGQMASNIVLLLVGLFIALVAANVFEQPRAQRALAALNALVAAGLLVAMPLFLLDFMQLRPEVRPEVKTGFDIVGTQTLIKLLFALAITAVNAVTAFRTSRLADAPAKRAGGRNQDGSPLVAGVTTGRGAAATP